MIFCASQAARDWAAYMPFLKVAYIFRSRQLLFHNYIEYVLKLTHMFRFKTCDRKGTRLKPLK